ncbi:MAG: biotin synthase BioB [Candidatus Lightella neohaematopini]|nr:biotin synthase BioB [Candidatus Lightella neohaematopini]
MSTDQLWTVDKIRRILNKPFFDLLFIAQNVHRKHFIANKIQISTLMSIKTGLCPEDCKYCAQSARNNTGLQNQQLVKLEQVINAAKKAKKSGATRFCMGAAWRNPNDRDIPLLEQMIKGVKNIGLETCMTLGMLNEQQAKRLAKAGLDFYNHNLDTSPEFYKNITTTHSYKDRLDSLDIIRKANIKICSGGILGLGETIDDRISLLVQLANLPKPPESIPINMLVKIKGTPLANNNSIDPFEFIRIIATTRIIMPTSYIRLAAGREYMNEQTQALCFISGANSIFYGEKLLTTSNPSCKKDKLLFSKLNITTETNLVNIVDEQKQIFNNNKYYDASI